MLDPRTYQTEAVDAVFDYWATEGGNPLVELATGTGKSLIGTMIAKRIVEGWPDMRILSVTHVAELIEQNYLELMADWPFAPAGILSAGLGRRDHAAQILFAGIQTAYNKTAQIGHVDVLMVDEAHLIPVNAETMYGKFIAALRTINPDMRVVGFTATPYRLDSGRLDEGDGRLFDKVVYTYGIGAGIEDGYLAPLSSKPTKTAFDLSGVHRQGGDYKQGELQAAVDVAEVYQAAVREIVEKGRDRRSWLVFAAGVENALHIRDEIRSHGMTCETVTGETPKGERREILEAFKAYEIRAITNNSVLTTGFNHKGVDLIAAMRPTLSASLYVQMMGRGTRPIYGSGTDLSSADTRRAGIAAGPKPNCLVLDFAGLVRKHGPVDRVEPKKPGKGEGEAPVKQCPACDELVHASVKVCPACGHQFVFEEKEKISRTADVIPILSTDAPEWYPVLRQTYRQHDKVGGLPSVRCDYDLARSTEKTWICPQHSGFAKSKADRYWSRHGGKTPFPSSVAEFLDRAGELRPTTAVQVKYGGRFAEVVGWRADDVAADDPPPTGNLTAGRQRVSVIASPAARPARSTWVDDDIPF